jgi:hypothetical protein
MSTNAPAPAENSFRRLSPILEAGALLALLLGIVYLLRTNTGGAH